MGRSLAGVLLDASCSTVVVGGYHMFSSSNDEETLKVRW